MTQAAKKVKVDMNPKRVQNPYEQYKRNPGKFDQRVYMEQENFSSNAVREMSKVHSLQMHATVHKYEKEKLNILKKKTQLESTNTSYNFLKQLRQAFNDESKRRNSLVRRIEAFKLQENLPVEEEPQEEEEVKPEEPQKNYRPWENTKQKLPPIKKSEEEPKQEVKMQCQATDLSKSLPAKLHGQLQADTTQTHLSEPTTPIPEADRLMLENLSQDIMTATLPANRLRRILPEQPKGVGDRYPIMSNYRRNLMLPDVRKYKRQMNTDTQVLHSKIQHYFGVNVPLSTYTIPRSSKPRKQKLLKAISEESFNLPKPPKSYDYSHYT